jgi:hypothetical protein
MKFKFDAQSAVNDCYFIQIEILERLIPALEKSKILPKHDVDVLKAMQKTAWQRYKQTFGSNGGA